jgi:hypothetical protein
MIYLFMEFNNIYLSIIKFLNCYNNNEIDDVMFYEKLETINENEVLIPNTNNYLNIFDDL